MLLYHRLPAAGHTGSVELVPSSMRTRPGLDVIREWIDKWSVAECSGDQIEYIEVQLTRHDL